MFIENISGENLPPSLDRPLTVLAYMAVKRTAGRWYTDMVIYANYNLSVLARFKIYTGSIMTI